MQSRITHDSLGNEQVEIHLTDTNKHAVSLRVVIDDELTNDMVYVGQLWRGVGGAILVSRDNGTHLRMTRDSEGGY